MVKFQLVANTVNCIRTQKLLKILVKVIKKMWLFVSLNGETQELVVPVKLLRLRNWASKAPLMKYIEIPFVGFKSEGSDYEVRSRLPLSILEFYWMPML